MGKGEGLSPSSKGSPGSHECLSAVRNPGVLGNRGFLPPGLQDSAEPAGPWASWGLVHSGMEETVVKPSVFVVDGQTDIPFRRLGCSRKRQPCSATQLGLGLVLLLVVAGLAVQGWFLLQLHWRLEAVGGPLQVSTTGVGLGISKPVSLSICTCVCARTEDRLRAVPGKRIHLWNLSFLIHEMGMIIRVSTGNKTEYCVCGTGKHSINRNLLFFFFN